MPKTVRRSIAWKDLRRHLGKVRKPARYTGGEVNARRKDPDSVDVLFALAFPDVYEVGMSHLGSQILYALLNGRDDVSCERVYAPWDDMEALLKEQGWPLFSMENRLALSSFDILGFSLQYELTYTNVLMMLDLGGIPLKTEERAYGDPLVIAGGPTAMAAEPLADFIDAFALGDGEELALDIVDTYKAWRGAGRSRRDLLAMLSLIPGVYVPSFYEVEYEEDGTLVKTAPRPVKLDPKAYEDIKAETRDPVLRQLCFQDHGQEWFTAPPRVRRRVVKSLDEIAFIDEPLVPLTEPVHDRVMVELFRGCTQGCRFCQAGTLYRPVRERAPDTIKNYARKLLQASGYDEVSLVSLSSADYSHIEELISQLREDCPEAKISLPSLRVDSFSVDLARILGTSKTSLTLAPEAGSQKMRDIINKRVSEKDTLLSVGHAFNSGFSHIKLYFMLGLPGETREDVIAIADLVMRIRQIGRDAGVRPRIVVSVSGFVPKPNTPFQWEPCIKMDELRTRQKLLQNRLRGPGIKYKYHDAEMTWLEAVFARGDRKLAQALELAYRRGARFDAWSDHADPKLWKQAFADAGLDPNFYAHRERGLGEAFPWDHLESGVSKEFLALEKERADKGITTYDCRTGDCVGCGVCSCLEVAVSLK